ncbi:TetR/AcrR family transcriptional regulator [Glaesserella sp.]|uniref:TetR/AcrR family transcriptional regulator n=1 Tax=Glaesserella sp. TaxID=2094731 RepID=UPI0035A174BD
MLNQDDIRVIKTAKNIKEAFFALLAQKEYEDITVQDILDKAQINRTTFYKHYPNKNALAKSLVDEFKQQVFYPALEQRFSLATLEFVQSVTPLMIQNREKLRLLWKIETPKIHLKQDMLLLVKQKYMEMLYEESLNKNIDIEFQRHIYASLGLATMNFMVSTEKTINLVEMLTNMRFLLKKMIL